MCDIESRALRVPDVASCTTRLDLEAIKVGMNYPNGQSEDLDAGWPDERAPLALC